jgi:chromosome segregation ATPase
MNDTATMTMTTDLDRLAERVEKAAALVQQLKDDRVRLEQEREELNRRIHDLEGKLQGQDPGALVQELGTLKREQRDWQIERKDIAQRVESLIRKLERLE